ncbi:DUF1572 domain-containing protein [Polluticoccus soli]|uniref:DUF1572 domain-containing protein n=1 Tax=Polluticoccus soli TaxID=3034150 RepID=UPI0023E33948|nr:DUF1572 domain-containing protein [Flavipsychrobacter sp. JY13-12]
MATIEYLKSAKRQFLYYKQLGEGAMAQMKDEELFWQPNEESNSVATIVKHLHGNMLSRWTDFLTSDGEKEWRNRDGEFENNWNTRESVMQAWDIGWKCLFDALDSITDEDINRIVYIRNEGHTILEATNRQIAHYCYHVGQIVYIGKMCRNEGWKSLSIPRHKSKDYNADKFSQEKGTRHFTDDLLNK